jgi:hypothetical protein
MDQGFRRGFTTAERTELWDRWQRGESLKAIGRALVSRHRRFISRWLRMGHSSRSATSLEAGIDALGTRGDIERHCDTSIGKIDGWVVGPLTLDGEPRNQLEWRL